MKGGRQRDKYIVRHEGRVKCAGGGGGESIKKVAREVDPGLLGRGRRVERAPTSQLGSRQGKPA